AGRVWFGGTCEILRINAVVDGKILFHVSEKHRDVDDVLPRRASVFEYEPHILEYGMALRFDVVSHDIAGRIERHAGNFFAAAHTRPDARQKQQLPYTLGVRKCPYRFRRSFAFEGFTHVLFTAAYMDKATQICRLSESDLVIGGFSRGDWCSVLLRWTEACYRRQDLPESGAVNVPNSKKKAADDRSDDESDQTE